MAACKMISFNKQHKNLSYRTYFILFFIKLFRGGGGEVVIKYNSMGKMYQISEFDIRIFAKFLI